jgi:hypothetical protein
MTEPSPSASDTRPTRPALRLTSEHLAWLLAALLAAAFRLLSLAATPLGAAEGNHALGTWLAEQGRAPSGWAGSLTDALTALAFKLFGTGDAGARVVPALAGVALVLAFWAWRAHIGRVAALLAALLAALSPVLVADARNSGGQALGMAVVVVGAALLLRYLDGPRSDVLVAIVILLAWGLGTDGTFVAGALLTTIWLLARLFWLHDESARHALFSVRVHFARLSRALPIAAAGLLLAVSRFGLGFARLRPGALAEWSAAFTPTRPGAPWHYLFDVAAGYELPIVLLGVAGAVWVLRDRRWRDERPLGLLLVWLVGGALLALLMASRQPATLELTVVPCCLLGGVALDRAVSEFGEARVGMLDVLIGAAIAMAIVYSVVRAASVDLPASLGGGPSRLLVIVGPLLLLVFLMALYLRWEQVGAGALLPSLVAIVLAAVAWNVHSASSVAFLRGDEYITGERTTREGAALARLLVAHGGGVADVDPALLQPIGWYLRTTLQSGGHGGARLIVGRQIPAGYHAVSDPTVIARGWSPSSLNGGGMVRWWLYREPWGETRDLSAQLVVEGQ